jgi:hypothetical protein
MPDEPPKEPMPRPLRERVPRARRDHTRRYAVPEIAITRAGDSWDFTSPYEENEDWWQLIAQAFGTCSKAVVAVFIGQLAGLVRGSIWDEESRAWRPEECELMAAISIVASLKPRNEAEAAFAASIVATHLASMKVGASIGSRGHIDARTAASLAALNRTYAQQMSAFHGLRRGGRRSSQQTIRVEKHVHYHSDKHLHLHGEGGGNVGGRAHEGSSSRARARRALQCEDESRGLVRIASAEGPDAVPIPRRTIDRD